ncbi:MAG: hypothetical protein DME99_05200 [Verrucomicrobia bacterium]|nr:MAG: hypothetical protein DME99_05200 [Verrucomicrobiota bacterium]
MRRGHFPRGEAVLQLAKAFGVNGRVFLRSRERLRIAHASRVLAIANFSYEFVPPEVEKIREKRPFRRDAEPTRETRALPEAS